MFWFEKIVHLFFPSKRNYFNLSTIPRAPIISGLEKSYALFDYHSPQGKELVYYIKRFHDPLLMKDIANKMYQEILSEISELQQFDYYRNPIILSVPSTRKRLAERGFDQLSYFSKTLAKLTKGEYKKGVLLKIKETPKQALINKRHERFNNVRGSFEIMPNKRQSLMYQDIILVDDLITTGATVSEISKILHIYKVRNIIIVSIAH